MSICAPPAPRRRPGASCSRSRAPTWSPRRVRRSARRMSVMPLGEPDPSSARSRSLSASAVSAASRSPSSMCNEASSETDAPRPQRSPAARKRSIATPMCSRISPSSPRFSAICARANGAIARSHGSGLPSRSSSIALPRSWSPPTNATTAATMASSGRPVKSTPSRSSSRLPDGLVRIDRLLVRVGPGDDRLGEQTVEAGPPRPRPTARSAAMRARPPGCRRAPRTTGAS